MFQNQCKARSRLEVPGALIPETDLKITPRVSGQKIIEEVPAELRWVSARCGMCGQAHKIFCAGAVPSVEILGKELLSRGSIGAATAKFLGSTTIGKRG